MPAQSHGRARPVYAILLVTMVLASVLALPTAAPARVRAGTAFTGTHTLVAGPKAVTRKGKAYLVTLEAGAGTSGDFLVITITQVRNPDGPAYSSRLAEWRFDQIGQVLFPNRTPPILSTGTDTSAMRPYGAVRMTFLQASMSKSCAGKITNRVGTLDGTLRLVDARLPFDNDTLVFQDMPNARLVSDPGDCVPTPSDQCPTPGQFFLGSKSGRQLQASHANGGPVTTTASGAVGPLQRNSTVLGTFSREAAVTVPTQNNFEVTNDLSTMRVDGGAFGFVRGASGTEGTSTFTGTGTLTTFGDPDPCGNGQESVFQFRTGTVMSNVRADLLFGPVINFEALGELSTTASRIFTRDAP